MIKVKLLKQTLVGVEDADGNLCDQDVIEEDSEELELSFRDLVRLIEDRGLNQPSKWPARTVDAHDWLSTYPETSYSDGSQYQESLFLEDASKAKYWEKAWRTAGIAGTKSDLFC